MWKWTIWWWEGQLGNQHSWAMIFWCRMSRKFDICNALSFSFFDQTLRDSSVTWRVKLVKRFNPELAICKVSSFSLQYKHCMPGKWLFILTCTISFDKQLSREFDDCCTYVCYIYICSKNWSQNISNTRSTLPYVYVFIECSVCTVTAGLFSG